MTCTVRQLHLLVQAALTSQLGGTIGNVLQVRSNPCQPLTGTVIGLALSEENNLLKGNLSDLFDTALHGKDQQVGVRTATYLISSVNSSKSRGFVVEPAPFDPAASTCST